MPKWSPQTDRPFGDEESLCFVLSLDNKSLQLVIVTGERERSDSLETNCDGRTQPSQWYFGTIKSKRNRIKLPDIVKHVHAPSNFGSGTSPLAKRTSRPGDVIVSRAVCVCHNQNTFLLVSIGTRHTHCRLPLWTAGIRNAPVRVVQSVCFSSCAEASLPPPTSSSPDRPHTHEQNRRRFQDKRQRLHLASRSLSLVCRLQK